MKAQTFTRVLLFVAVLLFAVCPAFAQSNVYTYRFYDANNNVIATYIGPLITVNLDYTFTSGFVLNLGAITWVSDSAGFPPSISGNVLQPCFFVMGNYPPTNFACRILVNGGPPQGTEIEVDFIGPLPTTPGNYYWPDPVIGNHIKYFDGTNDWYVDSTTSGHVINRVEIVQQVTTYTCTGFSEPFATPISLKRPVQRVIPLKAQLFDANGQLVTDTSITGGAAPIVEVTFTGISGDGQDVTDELLSPGQANSGNVFAFDPQTGTWQFNLGTKSFMAPGTYTVTLMSGNAEQYQVNPTCAGTFVRQ